MTTAEKLRTGTRMSLDEFLALGETDGKWELDDGVLYIVAESGTPDHQFLMLDFCRYLDDYLDEFMTPPAQFYHQITTVISRELQRALEPDIAIILNRRCHIVSHARVEAPSDIVVEILSTDRNRDLIRKRQIYAEAGVLEYWPIDPSNDTVTLLELSDGAYVERSVLTAADTFTTPLLPGLAIPLADIFHHRRRPPRGE